MKKITIIVIDFVKLSIKKASIFQCDLINFINLLENNQIMIVKSIDNMAIFLRDKKIKSFMIASSIRSVIESL